MYVALTVGIMILLYLFLTYNSFVKLRNSVKEAFATMDVYLKMRWDLIPNLVQTVKGYAKHESGVLESIAAIRSSSYDKMSLSDKIDANGRLASGISKIIAVAENYPDLKSSQNFMALTSQLSKIEEDIANSRKYYNAVVKKMNIQIEMFPSNIAAMIFNFKPSKMFEAKEDERNNVKVEFE